jgi:hypothetical protein
LESEYPIITSCRRSRDATICAYRSWVRSASRVDAAWCRSVIVSNSGTMSTADVIEPVGVDADEADLFQQDGDLEHVAHRLGHRDHVVGDGARPEAGVRRRGLAQHGELAPSARSSRRTA